MGRTPASALNRSASSESLAVPHGQPWMDRHDMTICSGPIDSGSGVIPTTTSLPPGASPSTRVEMDLGSGAVARITRAPPSDCRASGTAFTPVSMYS
jgi:hypothetical protein